MRQAFLLGAGLGSRLRPLTASLPKPLIPVWNAPLITFAFDHLIADLGINQFIVNTHHAAHRYGELFPQKSYRGTALEFRYEEKLLDTAGGIDNIRDWLSSSEPFIVYNGDILTDLPLAPAVEEHLLRNHEVTLILRSSGANPNIAFDRATGLVKDLRHTLGVKNATFCQFTGIYLISPSFLELLEPGKAESVVFPMLRAIVQGRRVGGLVIDQGHWSDLGDPISYLDVLPVLAGRAFPRYGLGADKCRIHPGALLDPSASVDEFSSIGPRAEIGAAAVIRESIIWPGARVFPGEHLLRAIRAD